MVSKRICQPCTTVGLKFQIFVWDARDETRARRDAYSYYRTDRFLSCVRLFKQRTVREIWANKRTNSRTVRSSLISQAPNLPSFPNYSQLFAIISQIFAIISQLFLSIRNYSQNNVRELFAN
jgi:hypothetical protein